MTAENKNNQSKESTLGFVSKNHASTLMKSTSKNKPTKSSGIPKYVANRMARRIIITTGIPTLSGMGVFIGSYYVISRGIAEISPTLTLVSSAMCFFIGLLGLSYGILSASWDYEPGSFLGLENIKPNISRIKDAFKLNKNKLDKSN